MSAIVLCNFSADNDSDCSDEELQTCSLASPLSLPMINQSEDDASHFGSTNSLPVFPKRTVTPSSGELEYCGSLDRRQRFRIARRWDRMHTKHSGLVDASDSSSFDQQSTGRKSGGLEQNWSSNNSANEQNEGRRVEVEGCAESPGGSGKVDEGNLAVERESERKRMNSPVRADFLSSDTSVDSSPGREAQSAMKVSAVDSSAQNESSQDTEQSKEAVLGDTDPVCASAFKRDDISRIGLRHSFPLRAKRKSQRKTPPYNERLSASPLSFSGYEQTFGSRPNSLLEEEGTIPPKERIVAPGDGGRRNRSESCEKDSVSENSVFSYHTPDSGNESVVTTDIRGSSSEGDLLQDDRHKSLTAASSTDDGDDGIGISPLVKCEKVFDLQMPANTCVSKQEPTIVDGTEVRVPHDGILSDTSGEILLSSSISLEGSSGKHKSSTDDSAPEEVLVDDCVFAAEDEVVEEPEVLAEESVEGSDAKTMITTEVSLADHDPSGSQEGQKSSSSERTLEGALLSGGVACPGCEATRKSSDILPRTLERADLFQDSFSEADKVSYGSIGVPSCENLYFSSMNVRQDQPKRELRRRTASEADLLADDLRSWGSVPVNQRIKQWNKWGERLRERREDRQQQKLKRSRMVQSMYVDECDHFDASSDPTCRSLDDSSYVMGNTNSISDSSRMPRYTQTVEVRVLRRNSSGSPTTPPVADY